MVLGTVRREAEPQERWPKALKTKLAQGGQSDLSPLRSDGSSNGQAGGWTSWEAAKDAQGRIGKQLEETKRSSQKSDTLKKVHITLFQVKKKREMKLLMKMMMW